MFSNHGADQPPNLRNPDSPDSPAGVHARAVGAANQPGASCWDPCCPMQAGGGAHPSRLVDTPQLPPPPSSQRTLGGGGGAQAGCGAAARRAAARPGSPECRSRARLRGGEGAALGLRAAARRRTPLRLRHRGRNYGRRGKRAPGKGVEGRGGGVYTHTRVECRDLSLAHVLPQQPPNCRPQALPGEWCPLPTSPQR